MPTHGLSTAKLSCLPLIAMATSTFTVRASIKLIPIFWWEESMTSGFRD